MSHGESYFRDCERRDRADLAGGDIARVLERYRVVIERAAKRRLGPAAPSDAWEDVRQAVETQLLTDFRRGKRYEGFPYGAVVREMVRLRALDYLQGHPLTEPLPDGWLAVEATYAGSLAQREDELTVIAKLGSLSARERTAFYLVKVLGLSPAEAAERMQVKRNNVDQMIDRAKRKLREAGGEHA